MMSWILRTLEIVGWTLGLILGVLGVVSLILEKVTIINFLLRLFGYEIVKRGKIEFSCGEFLFYPTPTQQPSIVGHIEINNTSSVSDTLTEILLDIDGKRYPSVFPNFVKSPYGEFISTPFPVKPRGEGYYKMALYFNIAPPLLQLKDFADSQKKIIPKSAKLIIKRITTKKEDCRDITIQLAPAEEWPQHNGASQLAKISTYSNKIYEEHI